MWKFPTCILKLIKLTSNHKLWAVGIIFFKFMSFISVVLYWRITQGVQDKGQLYRLSTAVKCPPLPTSLSRGPPSSPKDIYFVETSERTNPNFLFMCSVESAARVHPESRIIVLMKGLGSHNKTLPKHVGFSLLSCLPNIEFKHLDMADLFSNTPLAAWYTVAQKRYEPYFLPVLSDACRIAIMWKLGGIYLDTDFIVLRNLNNLTNVLGIQSKYLLNGAFLSFEPKHKFIELCMRDFVVDYNRWIWGHQGPQLLTRVFKRWCSTQILESSKSCKGVTLAPKDTFYPIPWQDWKKYFEPIDASVLPALFRNTYAAHVWNKKSQGAHPGLSPKTLLAQLQSHYCPSTYGLLKVSS